MLIDNSEENRVLLFQNDKCDKYDYLAAVVCGAIGGLVDVFLVGAPGASIAGAWSDMQIDNVVKSFASTCGWNPREEKKDSVASAIGHLEKTFHVNYDQRHTTDVGGNFNMSTKNHHIKSLSHSPDILGLFFSILDQFTSKSSFIADGRIIRIDTDSYELQGGNFIAKVFCGISNWFGHVMSDIAGSSGSRGGEGRGSGLAIPFYNLFQFCTFGNFQVGKARQDLATIAIHAFENGYDFRFGMAMALPVVITDLSIRLIWSVRRYFQFHRPLNECIPTQEHPDLRVMLLFGNGTLCVIDIVDAGVRSGGNFLTFFMRLNLLAWFRLLHLVLKEVCIRVGISDPLQKQIEAFRRINEGLLFYLRELEKIDKEAFQKETEEYNRIMQIFDGAATDEELNAMLLETYESMGWDRPWKGSFDEFMSDKNACLTFE